MNSTVEAGLLIILAAVLGWGIRHCLKTGSATPGHYIRSDREREPVLFWLQLTVYGLAGFAALALALQRLGLFG
jgi:hypothetical protein